jgi:signal transduction histidine kinase
VVGFDLETCPDSGGASAERRAMLQRALEGQPGSAEMELLHRDGRRIVAEIHTVPIQYRDEPHVLLIVREVTERRELEAQLRQAQKMEAIGQLTGGIAHDFNNILTSVLGYVAMAEERAATGSDARLLRQLGQARLSAERARDLVAQMLAFARRTGGSRQTESPARLVQDALELLRPTLPSSLLLEVDDLQTPVPDIEADAVQLGQVLMNLVINARDAVDGAGRVRIGLLERDVAPGEPGLRCQSCGHMLPMGRWVEFSVADDGCGITSDTLTRMFMPFFTTKPAGRGSGMGLAMVHGIVHDHRGHVLVDTATDRGAVFRVLLPAVDAAPLTAAGTAGSGAAPAQAVTASLPKPALRGRVLVVDDDALAGEFLRERLEDWGLSVGLAQDPRDALASIAQSPQAIDVLVTDLTMPHLSGLQLALQATRLRADLPVLLISGDLSAVEPARQREFGVAATLSKPLDPVALFAALRQLLG